MRTNFHSLAFFSERELGEFNTVTAVNEVENGTRMFSKLQRTKLLANWSTSACVFVNSMAGLARHTGNIILMSGRISSTSDVNTLEGASSAVCRSVARFRTAVGSARPHLAIGSAAGPVGAQRAERTLLAVAEGDVLAPLPPPGDRGLRRARSRASQADVRPFPHHHVGARGVIEDVGWH